MTNLNLTWNMSGGMAPTRWSLQSSYSHLPWQEEFGCTPSQQMTSVTCPMGQFLMMESWLEKFREQLPMTQSLPLFHSTHQMKWYGKLMVKNAREQFAFELPIL